MPSGVAEACLQQCGGGQTGRGADPPRAIQPKEIGVTGLAREGTVFPLGEVWQEGSEGPMTELQAPLIESKPRRRRQQRDVVAETGF